VKEIPVFDPRPEVAQKKSAIPGRRVYKIAEGYPLSGIVRECILEEGGEMSPVNMTKYRSFLKADSWREIQDLESDQDKGVPYPPLQKPYPNDAQLFDLVPPKDFSVGNKPLLDLVNRRKSRRQYTSEPLDLEELSFLLWATQGVKQVLRGGYVTVRTVPSAGARHPFETYLIVNRVEGLEPGLYRYLAIEHKLCFLRAGGSELGKSAVEGCLGQTFVGKGAVVFVWTVIPYRSEWRYSIVSHKAIALDAGHVCQNLYLASESIGAGTCAIAAYDQKKMDELIGVDGEEEFVIYLAPVGKVK